MFCIILKVIATGTFSRKQEVKLTFSAGTSSENEPLD